MRERKTETHRVRKTKRKLLLTLNKPLVPAMHATSYALRLPST